VRKSGVSGREPLVLGNGRRRTLLVTTCWTASSQAFHLRSSTPTRRTSLTSTGFRGYSAGRRTAISMACSSTMYDAVTSLTAGRILTVKLSS
jgi:hypothetical protein